MLSPETIVFKTEVKTHLKRFFNIDVEVMDRFSEFTTHPGLTKYWFSLNDGIYIRRLMAYFTKWVDYIEDIHPTAYNNNVVLYIQEKINQLSHSKEGLLAWFDKYPEIRESRKKELEKIIENLTKIDY